jgi:cytochrome P450
LQDNARNYDKQTFEYDMLRPLLGQGLLTSDGALWLRQRRLMQPAFHRQRILQFGGLIASLADDLAQRWEAARRAGQPVQVDHDLAELTLRVAGQTLMSVDLSGPEARAFSQAFAQANESFGFENFLSVLLPSLPLPATRRRERALAVMDAYVHRLITERRRLPEDQMPPDLLSMLLQARDEETGEGMSDRQVRDEVLTILLAGHETTANGLTWTFYLLSQHPHIFELLRAELERVLPGRLPATQDLGELTFTRNVFQEALRLYPPAWSVARRAEKEDETLGYLIPAGMSVTLNIHALHTDPRFWEQPERFDPDRFSSQRSAGRHKYAYLPFITGPRKCIGDQLAMLEGVLILATLASRFQPRLAPGQKVAPEPLITLRSRYGMKMVL